MYRLFMAALILSAAACATTTETASTSSAADIITEEELTTVPGLNALEAIQRLRSGWLRVRGRTTFNAQQGVRVYVNGMSRGGVGELRTLRARNIESMRFLNGRDATTRFGVDHTDGAILVRLRR